MYICNIWWKLVSQTCSTLSLLFTTANDSFRRWTGEHPYLAFTLFSKRFIHISTMISSLAWSWKGKFWRWIYFKGLFNNGNIIVPRTKQRYCYTVIKGICFPAHWMVWSWNGSRFAISCNPNHTLSSARWSVSKHWSFLLRAFQKNLLVQIYISDGNITHLF